MPPSTLRETVLQAAVDYIADHGPDRLSFRQVAAAAGVSHQAPYHHFGDRRAIFEAIALDGFTMLNDALLRAAKTEDTEAAALAMGERYIEFALSHRGHFRVMFRSDLCHVAESAELQAAADAAFETLVDQARRVVGDEATPDEVQVQATMMWALAHGLATLLIDGSLDRHVGSVRRRRALVHSVLLSSGFGSRH